MKTGSRTAWTFVITSIALFMVTLDNLVVTMALPVIREDLDASLVTARVDGQRVHPDVRRVPPDRRSARRPVRTQAHVRGRNRDLHARLGRCGARAEHRGTRHRQGHPGPRRSHRHPAHAHAPQRSSPGREARVRARRLGRDRRPRRRTRARRRRRDRRRHLLAVDLLAERSHRSRPRPARVASPDREPWPGQRARLSRPRAGQRRPVRHRVGPRPRRTARAGRAPRSSAPS